MIATSHDFNEMNVSAWYDEYPGVAITGEDGYQIFVAEVDIERLIAALQDCKRVLDLARAIP